MIELKTWSGSKLFKYEGSVIDGIKIFYGTDYKNKTSLDKETIKKLLNHFSNKKVLLNTNRIADKPGSVGNWLRENVNKTAITSYLGPILIHENYATKEGEIIIFQKQDV